MSWHRRKRKPWDFRLWCAATAAVVTAIVGMMPLVRLLLATPAQEPAVAVVGYTRGSGSPPGPEAEGAPRPSEAALLGRTAGAERQPPPPPPPSPRTARLGLGPCNRGNEVLGGPLLNTLVIVIKDSYGRTDRARVLGQVQAAEQTWARWFPHVEYLIQEDKSPKDTVRVKARDFLRDAPFAGGGELTDAEHYVQTVGGGRNGHWKEEMNKWSIIYHEARRLRDVDWVFVVNLQTYVIGPNLCSLLTQLGPRAQEPLFIGRPMLITGAKQPGAFESAGQLFNWVAYDTFRNHTGQFQAILRGGGLAEHLAGAGVFVRDSRDEHGRERFHSFTVLGAVYEHSEPWSYSYSGWFASYSFYGYHAGLECCAETSVSFHYLDPPEQRAFHYALNRAAWLRSEQGLNGGALVAELFGSSWTSDPALNEWGYIWRDPAVLRRARAPRLHKYNNSLVRELIAGRLRLAEHASWNVARILQKPIWSSPGWLAAYRNRLPRK